VLALILLKVRAMSAVAAGVARTLAGRPTAVVAAKPGRINGASRRRRLEFKDAAALVRLRAVRHAAGVTGVMGASDGRDPRSR